MRKGYFTKFKEMIGFGKDKHKEEVNLLRKYQKPTTIHSKQIYKETWRQLNKNFKDSGYSDAKITKDGHLRIGKDFYHVKRDLEKNTPNAVKEIVGYFKEHEGLDARKTKDVQKMRELYRQISSSTQKPTPTIKSQRPVMYGKKHKNQLNKNLEDFNAKYTDGKLRVGKKTYHVRKNLEGSTEDALKEITYHIAKHKNLKKKDINEIKDIYKQLSTDMLTPRRVAPLKSLENISLIALAAISTLLLLPQNKITGNAISSISHQTNELALMFCLLGIIGIMFSKVHKKHKMLKELK